MATRETQHALEGFTRLAASPDQARAEQQLSAMHGTTPVTPSQTPLSRREREVLAPSPNRASNQRIAGQLFIRSTPSTGTLPTCWQAGRLVAVRGCGTRDQAGCARGLSPGTLAARRRPRSRLQPTSTRERSHRAGTFVLATAETYPLNAAKPRTCARTGCIEMTASNPRCRVRVRRAVGEGELRAENGSQRVGRVAHDGKTAALLRAIEREGCDDGDPPGFSTERRCCR